MKKKRCYISGKITGLSELEVDNLFFNAKIEVTGMKMIPVSPVELLHNHDKSWSSYIREDITALMTCDCIYLMKNWFDSAGAQIEYNLAVKIGIEVICQK